jgi:hypothetical protein
MTPSEFVTSLCIGATALCLLIQMELMRARLPESIAMTIAYVSAGFLSFRAWRFARRVEERESRERSARNHEDENSSAQ